MTPELFKHLCERSTEGYSPCQCCGYDHGGDDVDICPKCRYQPIYDNPTNDPEILAEYRRQYERAE